MNEEIISNFGQEIAEDILKQYLDKYSNLAISLNDYENNV